MKLRSTATRDQSEDRSSRNQDDCASQGRSPLWLRAYGIDSTIIQTPKGEGELEPEHASLPRRSTYSFTLNCKLSTRSPMNPSLQSFKLHPRLATAVEGPRFKILANPHFRLAAVQPCFAAPHIQVRLASGVHAKLVGRELFC